MGRSQAFATQQEVDGASVAPSLTPGVRVFTVAPRMQVLAETRHFLCGIVSWLYLLTQCGKKAAEAGGKDP
ncbi:hypothetical protein [Pannonibacter phragmitetus]|uniref:hypothetical protein n=1 Tax=Pannonibacter phragmitetus TaxID=121719 RepID=UPI003D2EC4F5